MYEAPIQASAEVVRALRPELYELRLPNGKITLGHFSKELKEQKPTLEAGVLVEVELTPFDFDSARISALQPG